MIGTPVPYRKQWNVRCGMAKAQSKRHYTMQTGYPDGKVRKKSLRKRKSSPYWYIHYVDQNLNRQKVSTGLSDLNEALIALHSFNPFEETTGLKSRIKANTKSSSSSPEIKESLRGAVDLTIAALREGEIYGKQVRDYRESTLNGFKHAFNRFARHCESKGKYTKVADLKPSEAFRKFFDEFLREIEATGKGRTMVTLRNYKRDLGNFADLMIEAGYLDENPFRYSSGVLKTTQEEKRTNSEKYTTFSPDEFSRILREFDVRLHNLRQKHRGTSWKTASKSLMDCRDMSVVSFFSAMRLGEVAHLTWSDVDWKARTVSVTATKDWSPKTKESFREIPVDSEIFWEVFTRRYKEYKRLIERTYTAVDGHGKKYVTTTPTYNEVSNYVFQRGYRKDYVSHKFKEIIRACFGKEDPRHFHSLRHSAISIWVNDNQMPITEAMDLAGHKSIQTTLGYRRRQVTSKVKRHHIDLDYKPDFEE